LRNRSVPDAIVIPVLGYDDAVEAAEWLSEAFGFVVRLRIANHRVQLVDRDGALIVTDSGAGSGSAHSVLVQVDDVDEHHARAVAAGAQIVSPPTDYPYGERQYTAEDVGSHRWTFSQSIADVDPADWGGVLVDAE
jgi:uncharacterized glyoxalase superfamily protein PhnB